MSAEQNLKSTVTKSDIVEKVYEKLGFSKKEAFDFVELVFNEIKQELCKKDQVKLSGFGNFLIRQKKARVGRNPQTGKKITITARRVLTFRPSKILKEYLNNN